MNLVRLAEKWGLAQFTPCEPLLTGMTTVSCLWNLEAICLIICPNFLPSPDMHLSSQQFPPKMLRTSGSPIPSAGQCPGHRNDSLVPNPFRLYQRVWATLLLKAQCSVIISVSATPIQSSGLVNSECKNRNFTMKQSWLCNPALPLTVWLWLIALWTWKMSSWESREDWRQFCAWSPQHRGWCISAWLLF